MKSKNITEMFSGSGAIPESTVDMPYESLVYPTQESSQDVKLISGLWSPNKKIKNRETGRLVLKADLEPFCRSLGQLDALSAT